MNFNIKSLLFLCYFVFIFKAIYAKTPIIDSLEHELAICLKNDSTKVNLLNELAFQSYKKDIVKSGSYLMEAENIAKAINYNKGQAKSLYLKGILLAEEDKYSEANTKYNEALSIYNAINYKKGISECYFKIGLSTYYQNDFKNSIKYLQKSIKIDEEISHTKNISLSLKYIGYSYADQGKYDSASIFYNNALELNIKNDNKKEISSCLNNIGSLHLKQANYPVALEYYNKSLDISEKINDTIAVSIALNNIGIIYKNYEDYDRAIENYEKSLAIQKKIGSKRNVAKALSNLGSIYLRKINYQTALNYYNEALILSKELNDKILHSRCLVNIGNIYEELNNYELAKQYYEEAKKMAIDVGYQLGMCNAYLRLATLHVKENNYNEALIYALKSEEIAKQLKVIYFERDIYEILSKIYKNTGDYKNALESHQQFKILNDSLFNKENIEKITQLEYEYKYKQELELASFKELQLTNTVKQTTQDLEKSQRNLLLGVIAFLVSILILGFIIFFMRLKNVKSEAENILIEQRLLRSQMTPHFIFNSLSVLQGMILNKEDKKAVSYLSKFSRLLRITLENSRDKTVALTQELAAVENYLALQNIEDSKAINYQIKVDDNIDSGQFNIPPMLIQPFIENAIEHAFEGVSEDKNIDIHLSFSNKKLTCTISDNGKGIEATKGKVNQHKKSLATTITSERLKLLSKDFKMEASIQIENRAQQNEKGTRVTLIIPYKTAN